MSKPVVYLHVGTRKSGTSYLQKGLRDSVDRLREQGVELAFKTRKGQVVKQLRPLQTLAAGGDSARAVASAEAMAARIARKPEMVHLITLEDLAELPQPAVDVMVGALADSELHLVVTARHWGYTIPSEWQQCVKERDTVTYRAFIEAIRDRTPAADEFLSRQDLPALLARWGATLPPERVHVVAVPPSSRADAEGGTLLDLFCGLVGIDPTSLRMPQGVINQSVQLDQAETLRRVNVALGDRLPDLDTDYRFGVREWLTRASLMARARSSIRLPGEYAAWCATEAQAQYDGIRALGVDLVGRPEDLLPAASSADVPDPTDAEVAAVAVDALADLATLHWKQLGEHEAALAALAAERDALAAELAEQAAARAERPSALGRLLDRAKRS